jgi:hypothetical protein
MKRGYYAHNNDEDAVVLAIVAASVREAKKIAWKSGEFIYGDAGWMDIHVRWVRDAKVDDLPVGVVHDLKSALQHGIFGRLMECECDECSLDGDLYAHDGRCLCSDCIEKSIASE